jgi:hypothetical protein
MSIWSKLFGKEERPRRPASSKAATSEADATRVHPLSMTHIIMIVDKSESLQHLPDLAQEVRRVWAAANPDMANVLAHSTFAVPTYYIEAERYRSGTREINRDHLMGSHLNALQVPQEHSVFVQLLTIQIEDRQQDVTLETVFRTEEARCIISLQPLLPHVG